MKKRHSKFIAISLAASMIFTQVPGTASKQVFANEPFPIVSEVFSTSFKPIDNVIGTRAVSEPYYRNFDDENVVEGYKDLYSYKSSGNIYTIENGKLKIQTNLKIEDKPAKPGEKEEFASNIFIDTKSPKVLNSVYEAKVRLTTDQKGFGLVVRAADEANWFMYGYNPDGTWSWRVANSDTSNKEFSVANIGISNKLLPNVDYKIRVAAIDSKFMLWIDDKLVHSVDPTALWGDQFPSPMKPGYAGFRKYYNNKVEPTQDVIYIDDVFVGEIGAIDGPVEEGNIITLSSSVMDVRIDENFPRVIDYTLGDKKFYGQPNPINQIQINDLFIAAVEAENVTFEKTKRDGKEVGIYTMRVQLPAEKVDSVVKAEIMVEDNILSLTITDIKDNGVGRIKTLKFVDSSILSVRSTQEGARFDGSQMSTNVVIEKKGDTNIIVNNNLPVDGKEAYYMYGFVSNNELSAGLWSNSSRGSYGRVTKKAYSGTDGDGKEYKAIGLGSTEWTYWGQGMPAADTEKPTLKVIITDEKNGDGKIDWQDGAIAYRDIMNNPFGYEEVADQVSQRIVMNFGSMATNPFLKTLDNIKKVYLATDGLGQKLLLKGYQSEGHDSAHPDYDAVGERIGGVADMRTLLQEGKKYGAAIGIHVNATETYPEAKAFEEPLLRGDMGWNWIDAAYKIDTLYDLTSGKRKSRLESLNKILPEINFLYVDAWYEDTWQSDQIAAEINDLGWVVATEWAHSIENDSLWSHWATDLNYGGFESKGINSDIARFIRNHQKDVWMSAHGTYGGTALNPLLGGYELKDFEGWAGNVKYTQYEESIFNINLPTKFLQHYLVTSWENYKYEEGMIKDGFYLDVLDKEVKLKSKDGEHEVVVTRGEKPEGSAVNATRVMTLDGTVILQDNMIVGEVYVGDNGGKKFPAKRGVVKDTKYLIPWTWADNEISYDDEYKLYHWNYKGGTSTWDLIDDWKDVSTVKVYKLTDEGRTEETTVSVVDGKITLTAAPKTAYVVYKGEVAPTTVTYGQGMHIVDPGFTSNNLDAWKVTGDGVSIDRRLDPANPNSINNAGNSRVQFKNTTGEASVSQVLTDLKQGQKYTALVYVENQNEDAKATLEIDAGGIVTSVDALKSIAKNYVASDSHNSTYMQTIQVNFVAPATGEVTLSLKREAGNNPTYFDDVRIVETKSDYRPEEGVFVQDFENLPAGGIYPFVMAKGEGVTDNRSHLSELNAPYTQRGWNGSGAYLPTAINDVINGDWSLKSHSTLRNDLLYMTIPQNFTFEPGVTYDVSFKYEAGSNKEYKFVSGTGEYTGNDLYHTAWMQETSSKEGPQEFTISITGDESGQTWFGIWSGPNGNEDMGSGYKYVATGLYDFVMDDLKIVKTDKPPVAPPENPYVNAITGLTATAKNADGTDVPDQIGGEGEGNGPLTAAVDGNISSYWHSKWSGGYVINIPVTITLDMQKIYNLASFDYVPRPGGGNGVIDNADFEYSLDGKTWTTVERNIKWAANGSTKTIEMPEGVFARYVRLIANTTAGRSAGEANKFVSAGEFIPYKVSGTTGLDDLDLVEVITSSKDTLENPTATATDIVKAITDLAKAIKLFQYKQ